MVDTDIEPTVQQRQPKSPNLSQRIKASAFVVSGKRVFELKLVEFYVLAGHSLQHVDRKNL